MSKLLAKFQFDELMEFGSLKRLCNARWACAGGFFAAFACKLVWILIK
jgi:hypothetical protein